MQEFLSLGFLSGLNTKPAHLQGVAAILNEEEQFCRPFGYKTERDVNTCFVTNMHRFKCC